MVKPENNLEIAIENHNIHGILQALAEKETLGRLAFIKLLGNEKFSDEIIFAILFIAAPRKMLQKQVETGWIYHHLLEKNRVRLKKIFEEMFAPLPQDPTPAESALIKAIVYQNHKEIVRLIREDGVQFHGFAPELLLMLPEISKEAALTFLRDGLSPKLKAIVLSILLGEVETPNLFENIPYSTRVKFANLMLLIMAKANISHNDNWYPEKSPCDSFYYFDPEHQFNPYE